MSSLEADVNACNQAGGSFHDTLSKTLTGLLHANQERKSEIDGLRSDHDNLRKDHDAFVTSAERENDLRRNEIKSLEERMQKENQVCKYSGAILNSPIMSSPNFSHFQITKIWIFD